MTATDRMKRTGTIEIYETNLGGREQNNWRKMRNKEVVMGIRERGGDLRLIHIESNIAKHLGEQIRQHVSPDAKQVITDELPAYIPAFISAGIKGDQHKTIRHRDKVYVQGDVHTN